MSSIYDTVGIENKPQRTAINWSESTKKKMTENKAINVVNKSDQLMAGIVYQFAFLTKVTHGKLLSF